jgi:hypothetical protein
MVMCRVKDPGERFSFDGLQHAAIANPQDDLIRHIGLRDAKGCAQAASVYFSLKN